MDAETYAVKLSELKKKVSACLGDDKAKSDNILRRRLYGLLDRLRLDVEEVAEENALKGIAAWPTESELNEVNAELDAALKSIPLVAVRRTMKESFFFYNPVFILLETYIRFVGVACSIFFAGAFLSIPILLLRVIDIQLQRDPYNYYSESLKKLVTTVVLYQAGLQVTVLGLSPDLLASTNCFIMAFTHACNIDGFIVAGTCPVRQLAFGKKELFMAPFFSWLSLAIGGIPVDRGNRDRAIKALERSVQDAKASGDSGKVCIAIAPEGTRSQSGQLLPFKKGAFYMWEEMREAPLVPFITYGAYDLYHPKHWVNNTGHIAVRYLPALPFDASLSRAQQSRKVRRMFLDAIDDCPQEVGRDISPFFKISSLVANALVVALNVQVVRLIKIILIDFLKMSVAQAWMFAAALSAAITFALYFYYVYAIYWGSKSKVSKKTN